MKNIFRELKGTLIITSVLTPLPLFAGLLLWNVLPDVLVTHWGIDNQPNGYMSKAAVVFGLPFFMLAIQYLCTFLVFLEKKNRENLKNIRMVLWIVPVISILCGAVTYAYACGVMLNVGFIITAAVGLIFAAVGFYLPKFKQNSTVGVRLPWTLNSEDNWEKTHRLAGGVWIAGGLLITLTSPLSNVWILMVILLVMIMIPLLYSFWYSKQENKI